MEISYNLRYQKSTFSNRTLIDKEGEVIIYDKGFRLKGKGATDKGELINFSEVKEFYYKNERIFFITFSKEKYTLSDAGTLFDQLLKDLYRSRNEFLMDALFMKGGKLKAEFDGHFKRLSKFQKFICKGEAKIRLYEKTMVVIPPNMDAFSINFNFVNFHEFDELDYNLKIVMDDGSVNFFSHLGNDFEIFEEKINELLGGLYDTLVNENLRQAFPQFHAATLLKLAYRMKGGKAVSEKDIIKIDEDLAASMDEFMFDNEEIKNKFNFLRTLGESEVFYAIAKDDLRNSFIRWALISIPENNMVAFTVFPPKKIEDEAQAESKTSTETYFYKIIMEKGNPVDKQKDKVLEIEQALVTLNFVKDPCYMDKRDLRHSPYQYAIRKMPFLRILRKSYVGSINTPDEKEWKKKAKELIKKTKLSSN
ncbi:hypothetical protein GF354_00115 [Candidatus Peregrinibacteria bacterium]|nr:hypothetical protein [Candidatus Peregrinibacteria bacterium]